MHELCPKMPVLDHMQLHYGLIRPEIDFFVGLQHLFGSTASLVRSIIDGRIETRNVFMLGKPYSANRDVVQFMEEKWGFWVHEDSCEQAIGRENDGEMDRRIDVMLERLRISMLAQPEKRGKVLLIDDGGRAIRAIHAAKFRDIRDRFVCVEQTRAGIRHLEQIELQVPVVNVAESWVKLEHESPMIAESINAELSGKFVAMAAAGIPVGQRALVIGFGAIGQAVSAKLRSLGRTVSVFDTDRDSRRDARDAGYHAYDRLRPALRRNDLIIGCTGKPAIDRADHFAIRDGAILVSASSADVEFRGWQMRPNAECLGVPEHWNGAAGSDGHPCFSLYRIANGRSGFYLVNGGFPVNFNGGVDPIAPDQIQLTRSLLYLGAVQASHALSAGLAALDSGMQRSLLGSFRQFSPSFFA
jgi:S-adenosylhomocysteine hydrolase